METWLRLTPTSTLMVKDTRKLVSLLPLINVVVQTLEPVAWTRVPNTNDQAVLATAKIFLGSTMADPTRSEFANYNYYDEQP